MPPILVLVAICAGLAACERRDMDAPRRQDGPAVARVDGQVLRMADFESILPEDHERILTGRERREYFDRWLATELVYEEALRSGEGVTPDIQTRLDQYKKDLVADQFVQKVLREKAVVTEAEVREYYESRLNEYTREYRVSHILVNTLEDAAEVKELLGKRTFAWVARRHSIDRHTGVGGDLGFLSKGNMIPAFERVVFDMEVGEVSDVIESEFGYHFIKLTDVRDSRNRLEFDDVAEEISRTLLLEKRSAVYDSLIASLFTNADVEVLDRDLRLAVEEPAAAEPADTAAADTTAAAAENGDKE